MCELSKEAFISDVSIQREQAKRTVTGVVTVTATSYEELEKKIYNVPNFISATSKPSQKGDEHKAFVEFSG